MTQKQAKPVVEISNPPLHITLLKQLEMGINIQTQVQQKLSSVPLVMAVNTRVSVVLHVDTVIPYSKRGEDGVREEMNKIFTAEQELMDQFPGVSFDFNIVWEVEPTVEQKVESCEAKSLGPDDQPVMKASS